MKTWTKRPLRALVNSEQKAKPPSDVTRIWTLNLDQIESHSGRVLEKIYANTNELGSSTYAFEPRTVLYSKLRPYLNKVVIADEIGIATTELVPIRCNPDEVLPEFLAYFLRSPDFLEFATTVVAGAKMPRMVMSQFWDFKVPLPPLPDQRRIAAILDQADALRVKRQEALEQLNTLSQSFFLDLFGAPATNPKGWSNKKLFELGKIVTGGTPPSIKPGMFDGPIPFVTPGDLESDEPVKRSLTAEGANESRMVRAGATLVCCIGATIGKMGIAQVQSAFNQQLNAVEWSGEIDDLYGYGVLRFFKPTIKTWGASTTLPILKKSSFEKIEIPVPPLPLQREFAQKILAIEKLRVVHKSSLAELDKLFISLQNQAFKGEL